MCAALVGSQQPGKSPLLSGQTVELYSVPVNGSRGVYACRVEQETAQPGGVRRTLDHFSRPGGTEVYNFIPENNHTLRKLVLN